MGRCAAFKCKETGVYKFPKDPIMRRKWEKALRRINFKSSDHSRLCGKHFNESDFETFSKTTGFKLQKIFLKKSIVPFLFDYITSGTALQKVTTRTERSVNTMEGVAMLTDMVKVEYEATDDQRESATDMWCKEEANGDDFVKREVNTDDVLIKEELDIGATEIQPWTVPHPQLETVEEGAEMLSTVVKVEYDPADGQRGAAAGVSCEEEATDASKQQVSSLNKCSTSTALHYDLLSRATSPTPRAERLGLWKGNFISDVSHGKHEQRVGSVTALSTTSPTNTHRKTNKQMLKCDHCDYSATTPTELLIHLCVHNGERLYKCEHCDYSTFVRSHLQRHNVRIHTGERPYKCEHCDYSTSKRDNLMRHLRIHTGERPYKCEYCNYSAYDHCNLQKHVTRIHVGEKPYKCEHCNYSAPVRADLKRHSRIHKGERPYKCEHCDYSASERSSLQKHTMRIHTGERPYKCEHCDYSASERGSLQKHIMRIHMGERPYKCEHCDYSASERGSLQKHIMRIHMGERPYKCEHCDYSASERGSLQKHIMCIHMGERPYKCEHCDYSAPVRDDLKRHSRIHMGERPYKCEHCDYGASDRPLTNDHRCTHTRVTSFKCDLCSYSAPLQHHLDRHTLKHNRRRKLYKCSHCGRTMYTHSYLQRHLLLGACANSVDLGDEEMGTFQPSKLIRTYSRKTI